MFSILDPPLSGRRLDLVWESLGCFRRKTREDEVRKGLPILIGKTGCFFYWRNLEPNHIRTQSAQPFRASRRSARVGWLVHENGGGQPANSSNGLFEF